MRWTKTQRPSSWLSLSGCCLIRCARRNRPVGRAEVGARQSSSVGGTAATANHQSPVVVQRGLTRPRRGRVLLMMRLMAAPRTWTAAKALPKPWQQLARPTRRLGCTGQSAYGHGTRSIPMRSERCGMTSCKFACTATSRDRRGISAAAGGSLSTSSSPRSRPTCCLRRSRQSLAMRSVLGRAACRWVVPLCPKSILPTRGTTASMTCGDGVSYLPKARSRSSCARTTSTSTCTRSRRRHFRATLSRPRSSA